jgi:rifampin ADP-ribosylating transferase
VPVVLLHAWGESLGRFDRLLALLPATIHAVAMDQRGHGAADKPADGYSLLELADDVVAFLDAVGLSSAVLLRSSSGGYVAQQVAIRAADRVTGLVLVGSPRSLGGRPSFADEVGRLTDPVDRAALAGGTLAVADRLEGTHWECKTMPRALPVPSVSTATASGTDRPRPAP